MRSQSVEPEVQKNIGICFRLPQLIGLPQRRLNRGLITNKLRVPSGMIKPFVRQPNPTATEILERSHALLPCYPPRR